MNVFDLVATLSLDKTEYEDGLNEAEGEASSFGSKMSSALGTAGKVGVGVMSAVGAGAVALGKSFTSGISATASYGDEIQKTAQKIGISTEAFQEWDFIAQHSGTSISTVQSSMKKLVSAVDSGSEAFEAIGLSLEDVQNMSQEDLFSAVITQLQGMDEGIERSTLAQELLGKGAQELAPLLNTSAEATAEMRQQVHDLGGVLSDDAINASADFQDSLQNLGTAVKGLKNGALAQFLPACTGIMDGLTAIFGGDSSGVAMINDGVNGIIDNITEMLPELTDVALSIVENLATSILENLPALMDCAVSIIMGLSDFLISNLPLIIETGLQVLMSLALGIAQALPSLIPTIIDVILQVIDVLISNADMLVDGAIALILGLAEGLINAIPILIEKIPTIIISIVEALIRNAPKILQAGVELLKMLWEGLKSWIGNLGQKIPEIITKIKEKLLEGVQKMKDVGKNLLEGLWNGINDKIQWIKDKIAGFGETVMSTIKGIFGIHSPSKAFAEVGKYMAEGLGVGWDKEIGDITDDMKDSLDMDYAPNITSNTSAMNALSTQPVLVSCEIGLEPNSEGLFRIVRNQNRINTKATGVNALALA